MQGYALLGQTLREQREIDSAIRQFEKALALQPKSIPLITVMGNLYLDQGNLEKARKYYEQAVAVDPNSAIAANNLAWAYAAQGANLDVALSLAQKAKQLLPDLDPITDTLAWVEYKKGSYASAIPLLQECVQKAPQSPVYRYHLGMALLASGDQNKGREQLQVALRLKLEGGDAEQARQALAKLN